MDAHFFLGLGLVLFTLILCFLFKKENKKKK
jgi:hypothetical protein